MPSWGLHVYIAKCVNDKLKNKLNENDFIFANVLPDIYSSYIIKNATKKYEYDLSHFASIVKLNDNEFKLPSFDSFINEHRDKLSNPIIIGYLSHLMADHIFNKYAFLNHYIKDKNGKVTNIILKNKEVIKADNELARLYKQNDTAIFSNYILKKNVNTYFVRLNDNIIKYSKDIKNMEISDCDLYKVEDYLNNMLKNKFEDILQSDEEYKMFTKEELYNLTLEIIESIVEMINKINY